MFLLDNRVKLLHKIIIFSMEGVQEMFLLNNLVNYICTKK
jgi:hypothetical protein